LLLYVVFLVWLHPLLIRAENRKNNRELERRPASAAERPAILPGRPREGACGKFLHCKIPIYLS
jgi:hypothetical protein